MKTIILTTVLLLASVNASAFAKATICRDQAIAGATAIFNVNNKDKGKVAVWTELVDMDHSEGGSEVWDVKIKKNNVQYSPYRMTVIIDGCVITGFSMPFAG